MPPTNVRTPRQLIYWQYAKIISESAGMGKKNYGMIMNAYKKLCDGTMSWSTSVREWIKERDHDGRCIYCGGAEKLTTDHLLPRSCGGEDILDNVVSVCKSCNSSKGNKGLYAWKKLDAKDHHHRISEGKYLKYLYQLHEEKGTLDATVGELCGCCALGALCVQEEHEGKLTVYCLEGCFLHQSAKGKSITNSASIKIEG